jgi:hypothetical protein
MSTKEGKTPIWLLGVLLAVIVSVTPAFGQSQTTPPTINFVPLDFSNANNACAQITMGDANASAQIFFTTDGTTPQSSAGGSTQLYNGIFTISLATMTINTGTINAIAVASGYSPSGVTSYPFKCNIPQPTFVIGSAGCPVLVADITNPAPAANRRFGTNVYYEVGGNGNPSSLSGWSEWTRAFEVSGQTTTIYALAAMGPNPENWSPLPPVSYPVNCGAPPPGHYDTVNILMWTGGDDARRDSEVWATMSGQSGPPFCLKASDNAAPSVACENNGPALDYSNYLGSWSPYWGIGTVDEQGLFFLSGTKNRFTLPSPQSSPAGFGTIDITLVQHQSSGDAWNIQGISVIVSDSSRVFPPATLLHLYNRGTGSNCLARLKASPDATSVRFSLNGSAPPKYVNGNVAGETASCLNNGG